MKLKLFLILLLLIIFTPSGDAYYTYTNTTENFTDSLSYVNVSEIVIPRDIEGIINITVRYDMRQAAPFTSGWAFGNIYLNNASIGIERQTLNADYTTYTQSIYSISSLNIGDVFHIKGKVNASDAVAYFDNLEVSIYSVVGNWTLDQGTGGYANDTSGFNNNGTITGATWTSDNVSGTALIFDGSGDYVTVPANDSLNATTGFTMATWVKLENTSKSAGLITKTIGGTYNTAYQLYYDSGRFRSLVAKGGVPFGTQSDSDAVNNTWYYVVSTYDGTTLRLYVNNVLQASTFAVPSPIDGGSGITYLGTLDTTTFNFQGKMDEIKIYNYALNSTERTADYQAFHPVLAYPTGGMSLTGTHINFSWHDTEYPADQLLVSTDSGFLTLYYDSTISTDYANITLPAGTYYWKVRQYNSTTGTYGDTSPTQTVSLNVAPATPGRFNITAKDEQTDATISNFSVTLYNLTSVLIKASTAGWANFSSAEVSSGEYLIRVVATNYAARNVLSSSPDTVTVYLPNVTSNVNLIAFYLVDTTGRFPASGSKINITKNNSVMVSSYFDADMKAAANLISGDSYSITISYLSNVQNWGNYIPISNGNVQIFLTQIGINTTEVQPFSYNITYSSSAAMLSWTDTGNVLTSLNYTVYKGAGMAQVHQLITSVRSGQSTYTITTPDIYYIYFTANTTQGLRYQVFAFDTRTTVNATAKGIGNIWTYGSFTVPTWISDVTAILFIILLAGGFGAIYAELGAIITIISTLFLYQWNILSGTGAGAGFMAGFAVVIILAYMKARDSGQIAMMAYKASLFLIFFNFAILIINTGGIVPGTYVDIYGNNCLGSNANSPGCILARISSLAPQETTETTTGVLQQIGIILITATAFGLIILTLQYMLALFWFSMGISAVYLSQLPISWEWKLPLSAGVLIIYVTGFMQYKAATSLKDKE